MKSFLGKNLLFILLIFSTCFGQVKISKEVLKDKIKGGWAGQTIGVTFGGPTEFRFMGTMINDYQKIPWSDTVCAWWYKNEPGLYDDLYMDLTFVEVFEKLGLEAPVDSFASAFANAEYPLWHANQAARYNILNRINAPQSGNWKNNPHADCIDFQIESDFAGLMSPAMQNAASEICDKIGHIMNYGDGWYGGVFISNMYSLAFTSKNIPHIINQSLKVIPIESDFYKCIKDVIRWHKKFPNDWKSTWFEVQKKWTDDTGCPEGVFKALNIDAKVNAAYIVISLLYGNGNFEKTMEIATRCGQDSDCNPSNAAGILGTIHGYKNIPDKWKRALLPVEDWNFKFTNISLNKVYGIGYNHALKNIEKNGGTIDNNFVTIKSLPANVVRFEKSMPNLFPVERKKVLLDTLSVPSCNLKFTGTGFVLTGEIETTITSRSDYVAELEITIDSLKAVKVLLPKNYLKRKTEIYWNYELQNTSHQVQITWTNKQPNEFVKLSDVIIYSDSYPK